MTVLTPDIPLVESAMVEMTNAFRNDNQLAPLAVNAELTKAARAYAEFLAKSNRFSHTADGRQPADRITAAGYGACQVAENLASNLDSRGFETRQLARKAIEGWKRSPGHRKNMLLPHVTNVGIAVAKAKGEQKYFSVQLFGRPQSLSYKFKINNEAAETIQYAFRDGTHEIKPRSLVTHTSCLPGEIAFRRAGNALTGHSLHARYRARDGDVYVLRSGDTGGIKIDVVTTGRASR
ncbi:MAG TPA: CAP domain-containing protein [Hyphomicrobiaceae bacterium]|nr:CAP domain-containing protein [Hyphomicrobiaceae bacterium]